MLIIMVWLVLIVFGVFLFYFLDYVLMYMDVFFEVMFGFIMIGLMVFMDFDVVLVGINLWCGLL